LTKTIAFCLLYALLNTGGAAVIKYHLKGNTLSHWRDWIVFLLQPSVLFAFVVIFLSALVMFKALSSGAFSLVIPIATGINFIFTVAIGYFLFSDTLNLRAFVGFLFILLGILLLSSNPK
jgi:uncharacterized membrane protein